jgi:CBS domain-containing protein
MLVEQLMATDVITTTPNATIKEVDELFTLNSISGAPVLEDGLLVGVISQSDVIRVLYDEQVAASEISQYFMSPYPLPMPAVSALNQKRSKIADRMVTTKVGDAMTSIPITVARHDDVRDAAQRMIDARVHRVLVTDEGLLVGILTALDFTGLVATDF